MKTGRISAGVEPAAPVPARERTGEAPAGVPVLGADAAWRLLLAVRAAVDAECGPGELAFTVAGEEVRPGADGAATVVVDRRARHVARGLERFGPPARELLELFLAQAVTPREAGSSVAVLGQTVILLAGNLGCQHGNQIAIGVPSRQRLVKDPGAFLILGADGEMRVEQGHGLPIQKSKEAAAARLGRLVRDVGCGHRHPGLAQHHAGHRRRQADGDHLLDKGPPRQPAGLHIRNQVSKFPFFHGFGSWLVLNAWSIPRCCCRRRSPERVEMDQVRTILSKQDPGQHSVDFR